MPIEVIVIPPDQGIPRWWEHSSVSVSWDAQREPNSPVISARGVIRLASHASDDDDDDNIDEDGLKVGEIHVVKVALGDSNALLEMDALTGDHELIAGQILDGDGHYDQPFFEWIDETFGVMLAGDPVFVFDLKIDPEHLDEDGIVAAHAALDALATFGSVFSPLVTFHESIVGDSVREQCRAEGLWSWVHSLRAERWKGAYIAMRPQY